MKKAAILFLLACTLIFTTACLNKTDKDKTESLLNPSSNDISEDSTASSDELTKTVESFLADSSSSAPSSSSASSSTSKNLPGQPAPPKGSKAITLTFPEGFTLAQIGARLEAHNICKKADFIKSTQTYNFSYYPLVKAIPPSSKRAYKLEGYLYPDTYTMYTHMRPQDAAGKFLRNAEQHISGYSYSGMTTDQLVKLASVIECESNNSSDMKMVSSVFHNRLKKGQRLEADSTRDYCTHYLLKPNGPFSDSFKYYYNTYRCAALPAGPICNPGAAALNAAAHPASTDYLYFFTAKGKNYYQKTMAEHEKQLKKFGMG